MPICGVRGNALVGPGGRRFELGAGHAVAVFRSVVVAPDASDAVVVSVGTKCVLVDLGAMRHVVDRVDLATREVERLADGPTTADAMFDAAGALYLQLGTSVRRYASGRASTFEELPPGVLLTVPMNPPDCAI